MLIGLYVDTVLKKIAWIFFSFFFLFLGGLSHLLMRATTGDHALLRDHQQNDIMSFYLFSKYLVSIT